MTVAVIVPAAGSGLRLGLGLPKALAPLAGVPLLQVALRSLFLAVEPEDVVVVAPPPRTEAFAELCADVDPAVRCRVVAGGADRAESVRLGLAALGDSELVLVHDAARPLTPPPVFERVLSALRQGAEAVVPVVPIADTLKAVRPGSPIGTGEVTATVDRSGLRAVQTPQGFRTDTLREAHRRGVAAGVAVTDDAGLVERTGVRVHTVEGDPLALKITTPFDLALAGQLVRSCAAGIPAEEGR